MSLYETLIKYEDILEKIIYLVQNIFSRWKYYMKIPTINIPSELNKEQCLLESVKSNRQIADIRL
jgi:hypothetical protein